MTSSTPTTLKDESGNEVFRSGNKVLLRLVTEERPRLLGYLFKGKLLVCPRDREKHLHKASNSYGFNYAVIEHATLYDTIAVDERWRGRSRRLLISLEDVKKYGKFLYFKEQGFERQIFVPLEYFKVT